jgi:hypothetical protein
MAVPCRRVHPNRVHFYKHGKIISYGTPGRNRVISGNTFTLGDNPSGYSEFFDGLIDEVRVYNRALSDEDIQSKLFVSSPQFKLTISIHGNQ